MLMFPYRPAKRVHKRKALQLGRIASLFLALPLAHTAYAADQWAISANDGHTTTNPAGKMITAETIVPDNLSLIRFDHGRPILGKSTTLPTSVEGPPTTAWIAPDSNWAIITAGSRAGLHPGDPVIEDDIVSIVTIDKATPHLVQTVHAGLGASQISVSPDQNWALVGNRKSGTVSVFSIKNKQLSLTQTISMGEKVTLPRSSFCRMASMPLLFCAAPINSRFSATLGKAFRLIQNALISAVLPTLWIVPDRVSSPLAIRTPRILQCIS